MLSILYLRCHYLYGGAEALGVRHHPFNSLFEMLDVELHIAEQYKHAAFNSLFEMPAGARVADYVVLIAVAFNSLFEMHNVDGEPAKALVVLLFQFSI